MIRTKKLFIVAMPNQGSDYTCVLYESESAHVEARGGKILASGLPRTEANDRLEHVLLGRIATRVMI